MEHLNIIDIIKLLGFLMIVIATVIFLVGILPLDKKISKVKSDVDSFKDSRILTAIATLAYGQDFVKRRIEFFERNQLMDCVKSGLTQELI